MNDVATLLATLRAMGGHETTATNPEGWVGSGVWTKPHCGGDFTTHTFAFDPGQFDPDAVRKIMFSDPFWGPHAFSDDARRSRWEVTVHTHPTLTAGGGEFGHGIVVLSTLWWREDDSRWWVGPMASYIPGRGLRGGSHC